MKKQIRIGILTFHYAHNYGAVLQAYALKEYLKKTHTDAVLVNYRNKVIESCYSKNRIKETFFNKQNHKEGYKFVIRSMVDAFVEQPSWNVQYKKFKEFICKYLLDGNDEEVTKSDLTKLNVDLFIAGSDQIWNKHLTDGYDDVYFLNFDTNAQKAFYAVSDGNAYVTDDNLQYYENILKEITYISTRESSLAVDISRKLSVAAYGVVDPSFLLNMEDYINRFGLKKKQNRFLFAYFVSEDVYLSQLAGVVAGALNLEVVELHYYKKHSMKDKNQHADFGPVDFLQSIYDSEFVITNSFHGTAFSLIFHKQFYSVYKDNARINNLLDFLNLQDRHIQSNNDLDLRSFVDYEQIDLDSYTVESKRFLNEIINNVSRL